MRPRTGARLSKTQRVLAIVYVGSTIDGEEDGEHANWESELEVV